MKTRILSIFLLLITSTLFAQAPKVKHLQRFDTKLVHFGFSLGINSASFALHRSPFQVQDSLSQIDVVSQSGFNLGIVSEFHLNKYFGIRFLPTLVFGQRNLDFQFIDAQGESTLVQRQIESTYLDFPILLKYRSARLNNFAAYIIGGIKYSVDLASNEDVKNEDIVESIIKLKRNTTSAEIGVGTDFFLPYFKFAIELKMSYGLDDVLVPDQTELSTPIDRIIPKMFFLTFLFEG